MSAEPLLPWIAKNIGWIFLGGLLFCSVIGQLIGRAFGRWLARMSERNER